MLKGGTAMRRLLRVLMVVGVGVTMSAGPVLAQMRPPSTPEQAPAQAGPVTRQFEGTVKKVDPAAGTLEVSRLLGLLGATIQVTPDTRIMVKGQDSSLADIREGASVKASYESQGGRNVATMIEVLSPEGSEKPARAIESPPRRTQ
jgi:Cu/Ag efflux protein CusF